MLVFGVLLAGTLAGCAAYQKCGFGGCPGDTGVTAEVEPLFTQHPALKPAKLVRVQAFDRVVYLTGLLNTGLERQMAESVALQAPGVAKVVNSIGIMGNR